MERIKLNESKNRYLLVDEEFTATKRSDIAIKSFKKFGIKYVILFEHNNGEISDSLP